jgi:acyl-CoA reductase-like NAD-dependent aldehyde dehydrogenase
LHLADAAAEAGIPGGVLNVVPGDGAVGRSLIDAPGVAAVAFTGSTAVGRAVAGRAAVSMQRLLLELGGKSPAVVLDDASLPEAVVETVRRCMFHSGQVCNALTKLVVPRHLQAEAVELALAEVAGMPLGNPDDPATVLGPLVSARQRERVLGILAHALTAGATVTRSDAHTVPARGWFVPPTIVSDVAPTDLVATEEIFGPVLCVVPYDGDDAAAVAVANHADFDLAAAVWAEDEDRALRVARSVRAGQVSINGAPFDGAAPFGGFRHSGVGRIHGTAGLLQFTEQKAIQHRRSPQS